MLTAFRMGILAAPLALLVACGGGGGGGGEEDTGGSTSPLPIGDTGGGDSGGDLGGGDTGGGDAGGGDAGGDTSGGDPGSGDTGGGTNPPPTGSSASPLTAMVADVPVVGEFVADCGDNGVGMVEAVVDTADGLSGDSLPAELPTLDQLLALADLDGLPVIGGIVPAGSDLADLSPEALLGLVPGAPSLGGLPVLGQLPTVCSSLVGELPDDAVSDPTVLLGLLGDPSAALGLIAILDDAGVPVGVILATLPSGLADGDVASLPSEIPIPQLSELTPLDPGSMTVLGSLTESLLAVLSGGLVGGLSGLTDLLDALGLGLGIL